MSKLVKTRGHVWIMPFPFHILPFFWIGYYKKLAIMLVISDENGAISISS